MVDKWIDNALSAKFQCHENENYVIRKHKDTNEDVVIPVDYDNTGITMKNTIWSNGLHQFVQVKHNLEVTTESLTSSFISNLGYIKLCGNKIFGMTGTLGSKAEADLLSAAYNLKFSRIPRFKPKLLKTVESLVVRGEVDWLNLVCMESFLQTRRGRSVLVICKTIKELRKMETNVKALLEQEEKTAEVKIKTYADEEGFKVVHDEVGAAEIIIATNIAGRGTDFKTSDELEANGGLHVIVSFLPYNKRVQDQAFGRTARKGKLGTAGLILKEKDVLDLRLNFEENNDLTIEDILERRDELEKLRLSEIKNGKLQEIMFNDALFSRFSKVYREFKKNHIKVRGGLFLVEDLKEFWAFWLQRQDFKNKKLNQVDEEFEKFKTAASSILIEEKISSNPYYSVRQAEYYLKQSETDKAHNCIQHALGMLPQKDSHLMYSAYFKLFEIEIEKGEQLTERFKKAMAKLVFIDIKKDEKYKEKAAAALEKAIQGLKEETDFVRKEFFNDETKNSGNSKEYESSMDTGSLTLKHLNSRYVGLSVYHQHATELLKQIKDSSKDANYTLGLAINTRLPYLRELDPKKESDKQLKENLTESSISELESVGLEIIYAVREVHDCSNEVLIGAQIQIGLGLASLAIGVCFPPALPFTSPIAGTLIAEGICDIVMELISKGNSGFDVQSYIKGKCISYGIAIATMGISALATCTKVLGEAAKICKGLAELLRKCPFLKTVCEKIANQLDKLAKFFEKLKYAAEFGKLSKGAQLEHMKELKAVLG